MKKTKKETGMDKKNKSKLIALVILLLMAISMTVYAYFTGRKTVTNSIYLGYNDIEVKENYEPPLKLEAGTTFTKEPYVLNAGNVACYVRIKCVISDSRIGKYLKIYYDDKKQEGDHEPEEGDEPRYNEEFEYNPEDGYWYYKHVLNPNEQTPPLFNTVKIADDADETVQNGFDIYVYAESIQAVGDDATEDITMEEAKAHFQKN